MIRCIPERCTGVRLPAMDHLRTTHERPRQSRLATVAWLVCSALLMALVVVLWQRMDTETSGARLTSALIEGKRPAAPALPAAQIDGDGAPGLPDWYQPRTRTGETAPQRQVLLVNFWASWCGPCEDEAPELRELSERYAGRVTIVGVDAGNEDLERDARAFVRRHALRFPIVRGDRADKDAWGVGGFPETFVVGIDGRLSAHVDGPIDADQLRALLDHELSERRT